MRHSLSFVLEAAARLKGEPGAPARLTSMKAGILTLQEADNYGAVLQAYALQTALLHLNVDSEFIIFEQNMAEKKAEDNTLNKHGTFGRQLMEKAEVRTRLFSDFRREYLRCTVPIPKWRAKELNERYDFFITGSDQVWNFAIPEVDGRYFLPFSTPDKRFSYAASFGGNSIPDQIRDWCIQQLENFRDISVREERGRELVKELTGRDSKVCADPVFLLEDTEWEQITFDAEREPYLLLYLIKYNKNAIDFAKQLAEERKVKIRIITASFIYMLGVLPWNSIGVKEWLSLIRNADCVITDSYHGIAFSMIFHRPFSVVCLKGDLVERNGRIEELLKMVGIEKCQEGGVLCVSENDLEVYVGNIRRESYEYLRDIIRTCF